MSPRNPKLKSGDKLSVGWLNATAEDGPAGRLKVDPRTGLGLIVTPFGSFLRALFPPDGWYLITASLGSGKYTIREQIETTSGGWANAPRIVDAYEANLNTAVPASSTKRVWATYRRGTWRFTFGACS